MRQQAIEKVAKLGEQAGSAVAVTGGAVTWLNENHAAVAALCAMGGLIVAFVGLGVGWYYQHRKLRAYQQRYSDRD
tara:strand:- start:11080 stop:11307 length:228 start_codon:yes stop_codon:yes gene_type:complete